MFRVVAAILATALVIACSDRDGPSGHDTVDSPPRGAKSSTELRDATFDAHPHGRPGSPLVAGESVRIGVWMRGGTPPVSLSVSVKTASGATALAQTVAAPARRGWAEIVVAGKLDTDVTSAAYWADLRLTDADGNEARAVTEEISIIGSDAALLPKPNDRPYVMVRDVIGRSRASFHRGEGVDFSIQLDAPSALTARVRAPSGSILAETRHTDPIRELVVPFVVPRLAIAGSYMVEVELAGGQTLRAPLVVEGQPFPAVAKLTIDDMVLWGGKDQAGRRKGRLHRGERLVIEARVGGIRRRAAVQARLRNRAGKVAKRAELSELAIQTPSPVVRKYAKGTLDMGTDLRPGRYVLELEATEGDDVSTRYREVLVE